MTQPAPLTPDREQEIRTLDLAPLMNDRSAAAVSGHLAVLLAEIDRLRAALAKEERLHGDTIDDRDRFHDMADKLAYAVAPEEIIGEHSSMNCPWENALDLITPMAEVDRLRARTLTAGEYSAAWHAVEGAAGEEGADPGTVLHAVLDRLGIDWQAAAAPAVPVTGE